MKCLLVTPGYPSKDNIYSNGFVHRRVKEYLKNNLDIDVFSINKNSTGTYEYDGVEVNYGNYEELSSKIKIGKYKVILVHFGWKNIMRTIIKAKRKDTKVIQWVHGVEALGWYRRLFNLQFNLISIIKFLGYIVFNTRQMLYMRHLVLNQSKYNIHFIFVSLWMKGIVEKDTLTKNKITNFDIIPNVIDDSVFKYVKKSPKQRFKVFNIRPYHSKKYANDLTMDCILELSKREIFNKLEFNLYGEGRMFEQITAKVRHLQNVHIYRGFLKQDEIAQKHKENGILLMPTRQDAQGVSMCEAMSSGLVPVVSDNTAIPEYANNEVGYLTHNYIELADAIEELVNDPKTFETKSKAASEFIKSKCSQDVVISKELSIIGIK